MDQHEEGAGWDMTCPQCKERRVKKFLYGLVEDPSKVDPRYVLGGCIINDKNPTWHCVACKHNWRTVDAEAH